MSKRRCVAAAIALSCALPAVLAGQQSRRSAGPPYDPANEQTLTATIDNIRTVESEPGMKMLIVTVTREGRMLHLIAAPPDWIEKQKFTFANGEVVEVTGLPGLRFDGAPAMLARRVRIGTRTLDLRDAAGQPNWGKSPGQF